MRWMRQRNTPVARMDAFYDACNPFAAKDVVKGAYMFIDERKAWRPFYDFCIMNSVISTAFYNTSRVGCPDSQVTDEMRARTDKYSRREEHSRALLSANPSLLNFDGVRLVKSFSMSRHYPDGCRRDFGDIDLLVAENSAKVLLDSLQSAGYQMQNRQQYGALKDGCDIFLKGRPFADMTVHVGSYPIVGHRGRLHFWGLEKRIVEESFSYRTLSQEDAILLLCGNGIRHGFFKVRDVIDATSIILSGRSLIDWSYLRIMALNSGVEGMLRGLLAGTFWLHAPVIAKVECPILRRYMLSKRRSRCCFCTGYARIPHIFSPFLAFDFLRHSVCSSYACGVFLRLLAFNLWRLVLGRPYYGQPTWTK